MKYILIIIICFLSLSGYGQGIQPRSNGIVTVLDSSLFTGKAFRVPTFFDTTQANTFTVLDSSGKLIFTRSGNMLWLRTVQKGWSPISAGSGSAWSTTGNSGTDTSVNFAGTTDDMPYQIRSNNIRLVSVDGNTRIVTIGDIDSLVNGITLAVDGTDAGTYVFNKKDFNIGEVPYTMPSAQGAAGTYLYNENGNGVLTWGSAGSQLLGIGSYLITTGGYTLVDSTLTILANIRWVFSGTPNVDSTNQVFTINTAPTGYMRSDVIWIDSTGSFQKTAGAEDTTAAVLPQIDYNGIVVAIADVDGSAITATVVSSFQRNAVIYTNKINGQPTADSVNLGYDPTTRELFSTGTIRSKNNGGVAFQLNGGSAVRAIGGNGILYLDANPSATASSVVARTGASYENVIWLKPSGNVIISSDTTTDVSSAKLNVKSTTKGVLFPTMNTAQQNAIVSPASGLLIYNYDSSAFRYYNGAAWTSIGSGSGGSTDTANLSYRIDTTGKYLLHDSTIIITRIDDSTLLLVVDTAFIATKYFVAQNNDNTDLNAYYTYSYYISGADTLGFILITGAGNMDTVLYAGGGGGSQDLHSVLAAGDTSSGKLELFYYDTPTPLVGVGLYADQDDQEGYISIGAGNGTPQHTEFRFNRITTPWSGDIYFPNTGTPDGMPVSYNAFVTSVNGIKPDGSGDVTVSGGSTDTTSISNRINAKQDKTTPQRFDVIGTGQSNMVVRDTTVGTWTYTTSPRVQSFNASNLFVTADPALNNICYSDATTATRNNMAWQFALNYTNVNTLDTVRILCEAKGSQSSYLWTPKTIGNGELSTSNVRLDSLISRLNAAPSDFNAKLVIFAQGEGDLTDGNMKYWLDNAIEFYDTLKTHSKVDDNFTLMITYPVNNLAGKDSLIRSLDSIFYRTKEIGTRNIIAVPLTYAGFDNNHYTNEGIDKIGKVLYSTYVQGYANGPKQPDTAIWKTGATFKYVNEKVVIGGTTQASSASVLNVTQAGSSTLANFERSDAGSDGTHQTLRMETANDGTNGFRLAHYSETSSSLTKKNELRFTDTTIGIINDAGTTIARFGNGMTTFSRFTNFSSNATFVTFNATTSGLIKTTAANSDYALRVGTSGTNAGDSAGIGFTTGSGIALMSGIEGVRESSGGGIRFMFSTNFTTKHQGMYMGNTGSLVIGGAHGTKADPSAKLEVISTNSGFLPPRMTSTQASAIASPAKGLMLYVTDTNGTFTSAGWWGYSTSWKLILAE